MDNAAAVLPALAFASSYITANMASRIRSPRVLAPDIHKPKVYIPKIGGLAVIISASLSLIFGMHFEPLWLLLVTTIFVGIMGLIDDLHGLPALARVITPVVPSLAILLLGAVSHIHIPLMGDVRNPYLVTMIVILSVPVLSNAVNMLDVVNGVIPGSIAMIFATMAIIAYIIGQYSAILPAITMTSISLGLYLLNKYPARVFNGNSGSYALGAALGAYAVIYNMGFPVLIASLPYVLNGLYIVASSRGIRSRERLIRPTLVENGVVKPNLNNEAPLTMTRLLVIEGPLREKDIATRLLLLFAASSVLSVISAVVIR